VFALGESVPVLLTARALIGVGVSACLMASFATFARWFEPNRQASLNGAVMAAGAAGALSASAPLVALTSSLGWRGTFLAFALIGVALSVAIFSTPERAAAGKSSHWLEQARAIGGIATSRAYWVFAPQAVFMIGGFMALQSLWAVPFLMQADGLSRDIAAYRMLLSAVGMLIGFISVALLARPLENRGIALERVLGASVGVAIAALSLITLGADPGGWLWVALGACYGVSNLSYALLQRRFALALAGRVNTTLNLLAFVGAFAIQWLFGAAIDMATTAGVASELAYRATLGTLVVCQLLSWIWFMFGLRRLP
jgi:predicted MFS family arabinose efflux permease